MKNGYKILWTEHALNEFSNTLDYLELNFGPQEIKKLVLKIENIIQLISLNPKLFPQSRGIHRVVILKYNSMYYKVNLDTVEILSFFSNRQNISVPTKKTRSFSI